MPFPTASLWNNSFENNLDGHRMNALFKKDRKTKFLMLWILYGEILSPHFLFLKKVNDYAVEKYKKPLHFSVRYAIIFFKGGILNGKFYFGYFYEFLGL